MRPASCPLLTPNLDGCLKIFKELCEWTEQKNKREQKVSCVVDEVLLQKFLYRSALIENKESEKKRSKKKI